MSSPDFLADPPFRFRGDFDLHGYVLALGFRRLAQYRRSARQLAQPADARAYLSDEITSPVTFGFRRPVVLLPAGFPEMQPARQQAILCHEFLHVERGDWL